MGLVFNIILGNIETFTVGAIGKEYNFAARFAFTVRNFYKLYSVATGFFGYESCCLGNEFVNFCNT